MSKAYDFISQYMEEHPNQELDLAFALKVIEACQNDNEPEDCKEQYATALAYAGQCYYWGWDGVEPNSMEAFPLLSEAYGLGNNNGLEELGFCYYEGCDSPDGEPDKETAMQIWEEGMELGNNGCTLRYCTELVDNDEADASTIAKLEKLATDPENPEPDACAILYVYYSREGDEDKAWEWREKGIDMDSRLMQSILDDEAEQEVGEDDWSASEEPEQEFEAYDDETEAAHPGYPDSGEKYVIIADTNDGFRIVQADASDWRSLPALIGAERCDDMRCQKFRDVAHKLMLPGTLLGQLDKDAFRKYNLEVNYHASQWYDGYADLAGDMIICMEDNKYNPFSFTSKEQAQSVIDALCNR